MKHLVQIVELLAFCALADSIIDWLDNFGIVRVRVEAAMNGDRSSLTVGLGAFCLLALSWISSCSAKSSGGAHAAAGASGAGTSARAADGSSGSAGSGSGSSAPAAAQSGAGRGGGSGAAPTTTSTAGAGAAVGANPKAQLDPNLSFDWPESSPGGGSRCPAGTYTGTFDCMFSDPSGLIPDVELSGPVTLRFSQSMDGEFLEISQGDFEAISDIFIGGKAKIVGKLDCNTLMLDAMAVDGQWSIGDPNAPLVPGGGLEGEITGMLDPATGTLSGQWNFADPQIGACPGTWSVMYAP
jgi:hypothetical protein